jgi:hypothetical protein
VAFGGIFVVLGKTGGGASQRNSFMDQSLKLNARERKLASDRLRDSIVAAVDAAIPSDAPFHHLVLNRVFPEDIYAAILANMPDGVGLSADARPQQGA